MKRILLVDDSREELSVISKAISNVRSDWKLDTAESAVVALQKMSIEPFDVVIADYNMPGVSGEDLLRKVMKEHPQTLRIMLSGYFDTKLTARVMNVVHQYLCKPCSPMELYEAIERVLYLRDLLSSRDLQRMVSQIDCLPTQPALCVELMKEFQKRMPSISRLAEIISHDLGLSTKLLQLVNSPFFGLAQRVVDVEEAIIQLGTETVKSLALSIEAFSAFEPHAKNGKLLKPLWNHSWAVGQLAQRIAVYEDMDVHGVGCAFTSGLLHDVGKLILLSGAPKQFAAAHQLHQESEIPLWRAEREVFGCTHAEVGAYLLGLWGLPVPIVEAVAHHHRPPRSLSSNMSAIVAVHVADNLTHRANSPANLTISDLDEMTLNEMGVLQHIEDWQQLGEELDARLAIAC